MRKIGWKLRIAPPRLHATLLAFLITAAPVFAAAPTLDHLYPAGGQQGSTVTVNVVGKTDPWPAKVWTDTPGLAFTPDKDKGKYQVAIAKDAPIGPHLVRLYNDEGASTVRFFLVSQTREELDKEPNDAFASPQIVTNLPAIVNGKLDKGGDVDSYAVNLEAGQWLVASLDAFRLASTVDAMLRIVDTNGTTLVFNHDGRTFDPFIAYQAKTTGIHIVQVMGFPYPATASERLAGGAGYIYRLSLTTGPWLDHAFPPVVTSDRKTNLQLMGWNLAGEQAPGQLAFDGTALRKDSRTGEVRWPGALNSLQLPALPREATLEGEPNNTREQANKLGVPASGTGRIDPAGDEDRFAFEVKKGDKLTLNVEAAALGFPLDAWLRVEDSEGREQKKADDDRNSADPSLEWTAPNDGTFYAVVGSVFHKGGEDQIYRLEIAKTQPSFNATSAAHAFSIEPGKTNDVKVTVNRRNGHDGKLTVSAKDLPSGVTIAPVEVPAKGGEVTLKLIAAGDAKPHNGPINLLITEDGQPPRLIPHELTGRGIDNGVPQGFTTLVIEEADSLWLTVLAKKEEKPPEKK